MAGDVEHVVDAAHDPVVAVLVAPGAVAGEVDARDVAPVLGLVAVVVAVEGAEHRRPGLLDDQEPALVGSHRLAVLGRRSRGRFPAAAAWPSPGTVGVAPGRGEIMIAPVSVCHQVSTTGQRPPPMTLWYHIQASGLIGSPTVPSRRRLDRSCRRGNCSPHFMNARMAVGAV